MVAQTGPEQEIRSLPGIYFFDGWRLHPTLPIPDNLPRAKEAPVQGVALTAPTPDAEPTRSPEEEARDILATAAKNQPEDGPSTRRAAVRACKYLRVMVNQYESTIHAVHIAARTHTQRSKGAVGPPVDYRPQGEALPVISSDLTSELLHCLSTLPDPWPLAKTTIDMEKPSQRVSKLCRLYFADEYARRTVGLPSQTHVPDIAAALRAVQAILPKLEVKMIEFLAEWLVTFLIPATHVLEVRAPHLSFMLLKENWFRELYLGLKVTASFDRSESYNRVIDGQVRCITPEIKPQNLQVIWNVQFITVFVPAWMIPPVYHSLCGKFKPKLVQKSFLRKSQDLHLDAIPTTYAQRSLRKRGSHTQALRFGAAQPFWTLSQRCCSNKKNTRTKATSKTSWTKPRDCLRLLLCSFLGFEPKATIQLDCNNCLNVQDPKIFLSKTFFH